MFNKIILVGNLTRDIDIRYSPNGNAIGSCAIATTRKSTMPNGEKREETCFVDITFFGRAAEVAKQYLKKGSQLLVEGRLKFDQWQDQNGQNRSKHSVIVETMQMLGSSERRQGSPYESGFDDRNRNYNNFTNEYKKSSYQEPVKKYNSNMSNEVIEEDIIEDDEIPF